VHPHLDCHRPALSHEPVQHTYGNARFDGARITVEHRVSQRESNTAGISLFTGDGDHAARLPLGNGARQDV